MSLLIRWSDSERLLRSVGDSPNGILGLELHEDCRVAISVLPGYFPREPGEVRFTATESEDIAGRTEIPLGEVVPALADTKASKALLTMALHGVQRVVAYAMPRLEVEKCVPFLLFVAEVRDALAAAGYIEWEESRDGE